MLPATTKTELPQGIWRTQFLLAALGSSMGPCTSSFFLWAMPPWLCAPLLWLAAPLLASSVKKGLTSTELAAPSPGLVKKGLTSPVSALEAALALWVVVRVNLHSLSSSHC